MTPRYIHLTEVHAKSHQVICKRVFIVALVTIAKKQKQAKYLPAVEYINRYDI